MDHASRLVESYFRRGTIACVVGMRVVTWFEGLTGEFGEVVQIGGDALR